MDALAAPVEEDPELDTSSTPFGDIDGCTGTYSDLLALEKRLSAQRLSATLMDAHGEGPLVSFPVLIGVLNAFRRH